MHRTGITASATRLTLAVLLAAGTVVCARAQRTTVSPAETGGVFANPGMGWQTFHRFADDI